MILQSIAGRHFSHRTKKEKWEDWLKRYKNMNNEEKALFGRLIEEMANVSSIAGNEGFDSVEEVYQESSFYQDLVNEHYEGRLVGLEEFIMDDYYLGETGKHLWAKWKADLHSLFNGQYVEAIISGSVGSGKTTFANIVMIRMFYEIFMLRNPQASFGLMPSSEIVIVCFNRDDKLARDVTYGKIRSMMELSPFFIEIGCKIGTSEVYLPSKNIRMMAVSVRSAKALGRDVVGGVIDETDFLEGSSISGKERVIGDGSKPFAEQLHGSIIRRMKSRYEDQGFLPGKLIMSSSAKNVESFTNRRIAEAANDPYVFCRDYALYEVKPSKKFSKEKFWVLVGNARIKHRILKDEEYEAISSEKKKSLFDEGCRFLHVPMNFKNDFERNIEDSIRDIGGCVTVGISPFIQLRDKIYEAIDSTLRHPSESDVWMTNEPPPIIWSRLCTQRVRRLKYGVKEYYLAPIRHPDAPRHVHIDLALNKLQKSDSAGICIGHTAGVVAVERRGKDGHVFIEKAPMIETDLMWRIVAPPNGEIDIGEVRGLVYHFRERGFNFRFGSMDNWNSAETLQKWKQNGIESEKISVDTKYEPYDYLKLAIYEGRLAMYHYPFVLEELEKLQRDTVKGMIDHPPNGTKDISDSLAGVVYSLSTRVKESFPVASLGISEYEGDEFDKTDDSWVRDTMEKSGDKPPIPVRESSPLIFTG
jgi:hypothetical protein